MVVYMDIDRYLVKKDFRMLKYLAWPWNETHFLLSEICYGCGHYNVMKNKPKHFVMNQKNMRKLLRYDFFWCENCSVYTIYDHYTNDECELCN